MTLALIFNAYGIYIATYSPSPIMKSIGFFLMGFFHHKISLSFCYATELCADKDKAMVSTFIQFIDSGMILIAALIFYFIDNNTQTLLSALFVIGTIGVVIFLLFIPESPRYIFMKDPTSQQGIRILNYIAWINGSLNRVPEDSIFDQFG